MISRSVTYVNAPFMGDARDLKEPPMNIELKDLSHNPVYLQVREQIENHIKGKHIASGENLPSPNALAQKLSVDRGEIQRAYYELEQLGLIKKHTGKDFLGKPKIEYRVS